MKKITNITDEKLYSEQSIKYENELDSEFKKNNGIFYTDLPLAKSIIDFLNIPKEATIIDPCCGTGSFIQTLHQKQYMNIVGCDFDKETVEMCKKLTNVESVYQCDTIGNNGTAVLKKLDMERFDVVIGNPPYAPLNNETTFSTSDDFLQKVKSSGSNLFIAAIYRAFELAKEDGCVSIIIPKNLLHISSYKKMRKELLQNKRICSIIELGIHFKAVRGEQIVLTFQNRNEEENIIKFYSYSQGKMIFMSEVPQNYYKDEIIVFTSNKEVPIYDKLKDVYPKLKEMCVENIHRGHDKSKEAIRGKHIRKFGLRERELPVEGNQIFIQNIFSAEAGITASYAGNMSCGETVTIVKLESEIMCKYILGLLLSRLCNYYLIRFEFNNSRLTIHADAKYLNNIPIVRNMQYYDSIVDIVCKMEKVEYMQTEWFALNEELNQLVYDAYQISNQDRIYIESEMRKISASKWYGNMCNVEK